MAQGVGYERVAAMAGVPLMTLKSILYGHRDGRALKAVRLENAEKILAVKAPAPLDSPPRKQIDATGTRRRLQALACRGYSCTHIAGAIDAWPETVRDWVRASRIETRWARAMADLFDAWSDTDAENNGATPLAAAQTRAWAARSGFVPAAAWTDIDDPGEEPDGHVQTARSPEDIVEDAEFIRATTGQSWDLIAERIGVPSSTLRQYRNRIARAGGGAS